MSDEGQKPPQETVVYHPPLEKKFCLTDLVKNLKQLLAKIMLNDSKIVLQDEKKYEEEVVGSTSNQRNPEDQSTNTSAIVSTYQSGFEEFTNKVILVPEDQQKQRHLSREKVMTVSRSTYSAHRVPKGKLVDGQFTPIRGVDKILDGGQGGLLDEYAQPVTQIDCIDCHFIFEIGKLECASEIVQIYSS